MPDKWITVLGSFVADLAFRRHKARAWGETMLGSDFKLGPGGKGSNQAVAAARLGGKVGLISKLGRDPLGDLARKTYAQEGIDTRFVFESSEHATGGAAIIVDEVKGENAIIVFPGACFHVTPAEIDQARARIAESSVFLTQLELQIPAVEHGLRTAHELGVTTILNPAPGLPLPGHILGFCDYVTPNESEAATLTGIPVASFADAGRAPARLLPCPRAPKWMLCWRRCLDRLTPGVVPSYAKTSSSGVFAARIRKLERRSDSRRENEAETPRRLLICARQPVL